MDDRLMLLDTASLYFRAFHGVPDTMRAPDGTPVNAVRGLLDFISRLVGTYEPDALVCCWDDSWRPAWRAELVPSYKAHRIAYRNADGIDIEETPEGLVTQIPMIRDLLCALGIEVAGADGYEADDIMGTLSARATGPVDVVTGDRDLFQLVSDARQVRVLYVARGVGRLEIVTDSVVVSKYGVLPEQYADFATLRGDASDGLPGVPGVGEKTAAGLLSQYGDLAGIVAAAADPASGMGSGVRGKIQAAHDYLAVAPKVVAVATDVSLPDLDPRLIALDDEQVAHADALGEAWGLGSSLPRVIQVLAARGARS